MDDLFESDDMYTCFSNYTTSIHNQKNRVMHTEETPFKDSPCDDCFAQDLRGKEQWNELFSKLFLNF